jgi:hypothetical protein
MTSPVINRHHLHTSAVPFSASSRILRTANSAFPRTFCSQFSLSTPIPNARANNFLRFACSFTSAMLNNI